MRAARLAFLGLVGAFLLAPLAVVFGISLNAQKVLFFPPRGLSLQWYAALWAEADWFDAIVNSVVVAGASALLAVSVAAPLAYALWRAPNAWLRGLYALGVAPFMMPPVITALGLLAFWVSVGAYGAYATVIVSHGVFLTTLPLVTITLGLQGISREELEAAETLGADEWTRLRTIVLPQAAPYAVSGLAFAFVLSLNEYIIAYMVAGFTVETLPIKIFNALRYGYTPAMASVAIVFAGLAALIFGTIAVFGDLPRLLGAWRR